MMTNPARAAALSAVILSTFLLNVSADSSFEKIKSKAESLYQEKSYAQAQEALENYEGDLTDNQADWVRFRMADLSLRVALSSDQQDHTVAQKQRQALQAMIRDWQGEEEKEPLLVDVQTSLAESYWGFNNQNNWGQAQQHYLNALRILENREYSEERRKRYLEIIQKPLFYDTRNYHYGAAFWPLEQAEHAARLARSADEMAASHFHLAKALHQSGQRQTPSGHERIRKAYLIALQGGKGSDWWDDALMSAGQFMESFGTIRETAPAQYQLSSDYKEALKLYRMITAHFNEGESRFFKQAQQRIDDITLRSAEVFVHNAFTPDSLIEFHLRARNKESAKLKLTRIDLQKAWIAEGMSRDEYQKKRHQPFSTKGEVVKKWEVELEPEFEHQQVNRTERIAPLPAGAYWLETSEDSRNSGTLILVTESAVTVREFNNKLLIFTCDAMSGKPKSGSVSLIRHMRYRDNKSYRIKTDIMEAETGEDGTAIIPITPLPNGHNLQQQLVVADIEGHPAFLNNAYAHYRNHSGNQVGKVYVFTERPAYRPGQEVKFKFIYRRTEGETYGTPEEANVEAQVTGPRGEELFKKELTVNAFGSASGNFEIPGDAPLGAYQIQFRDMSLAKHPHIGYSPLFRLEEYKLPEFKVSVQMPEKDGKPEIFRLGEQVKAEVKVEYYAGGAIADAEVEYDIHRSPHHGDNPWPEPYPWLYEGVNSSVPWMQFWRPQGGRTHVTRAQAKTDSEGKAVIEFQTQPGTEDMEFTIEARVTDASRRQVTGTGSVKVISKPFKIHLKPESRVYLPGDTARVDVKALDANGNPVETGATLIVTRERWIEKKRVHKKTSEEQVIFRGYDAEEIENRKVATDTDGNLQVTFKPDKEGFYRVKLVSPPVEKGDLNANSGEPKGRVVGEITLFACTSETQSLGYRHGALQLIPDKATYRPGETAKVIVIGPEEDTAALLMLSGRDLISHQVLSLPGNAKLFEFEVSESNAPNLFISGLMIRNGRVLVASEEVIIPPEEHFLKVDVEADEEELKPGESGKIGVRVTDHEGKPVRAELALGVIDASLYYIQQETSGDIRQFFFGQKNPLGGGPRSMLNERQIRTIEEIDEDQWETVITEKTSEGPVGGGRFSGQVVSGYPGDFDGLEQKGNDFFGFSGSTVRARGAKMARSMLASNEPMPTSAPRQEMEEGAMFLDSVSESLSRDKSDIIGGRLNKKERQDGGGQGGDSVVVRSDFRESAFWEPAIVTDKNGRAEVKVDYPESLTEWRSRVRATTVGIAFGQGEATTRTNLPVTLRFQSPRFLVEGDEVRLASVLTNQTGSTIKASVNLDVEGLKTLKSGSGSTSVPSMQQGRVEGDYKVPAVNGEGQANITAVVKSRRGNDGMETSIPLVEYGIEKLTARSLVMESEGDSTTAVMEMNLPVERKPGASQLHIQLAPSLASTCLDALPYLARYPYGCVEQTLSRFVPAAVVAKTLEDMGLDPSEVENRVFGGIEKTTPTKVTGTKQNLDELDKMVKAGMKRLRDFQHGDGGWGWWKDGDTDDFMTAYVVQGLMIADQAGVDGAKSLAQRGANYLLNRLVEYEQQPDMACWLLYAYSQAVDGKWHAKAKNAADQAYQRRDSLNAYTRALLALAYHSQAEKSDEAAERANVLARNLENGLVEVKPESEIIGKAGSATMPVTCHWGKDGIHYRWSNGGVEATAFALRALLKIDPDNKRVDQAARWLINNRRGAQWKNTRDTAIVIYTLIDYMKVRKETSPDFSVELAMNGKRIHKEKFTTENALGVVSIKLPESKLQGGGNRLQITMKGTGRLYASGWLTFFTKEKDIPAAGNEIYVKREYTLERAVETLIGEVKLKKMPLEPGQELKPNDRVYVRLVLEAKNNYEYLMIEDRKPAGLEALQIQSGEPAYARKQLSDGSFTGRQTRMYQELRDRHVAFFITKLEEGVHELSYMLRAETPGIFHALPATTEAMYVPEIKANSTSRVFTVRDTLPDKTAN